MNYFLWLAGCRQYTGKPEQISIWVRGKSQAANHQQLSTIATNQADICGLSNKTHFFPFSTLISTSLAPAFISKGLALYLLQKKWPGFFLSCSWFRGCSLKSENVIKILTCLLQAACKARDFTNYCKRGGREGGFPGSVEMEGVSIFFLSFCNQWRGLL